MSEQGDEDEHRLLGDGDELLYRQVHPAWVVNGEPSSQAFRPTAKDEGRLSITLGSNASAEEAFQHHTQTLSMKSSGSWAVSVGEAKEVELNSFHEPLPESPDHGFIDFRGLSRKPTETKAKVLKGLAVARGCLHP